MMWATVTSTSPLRVKLDGDAAALVVTPDTLVDPVSLNVDDRVQVELNNNRLLVLGVNGGPSVARGWPTNINAPDLNSAPFRRNGVWNVQNPTNGPYPTGPYFWRVRTWALDINWLTQEAEAINTPSWHAESPDTRFRRTYRNGTWTPWLPEHSRGSQAGSTALRNAIFGTPSTAAQKLALQGASWWNTERAWEERYFALYNASTQPNGLSKLADGWYPVHGLLPSEKRWQSANYTINATGRLLQWDTQISVVHDDLLTYSGGTFTIVQPGRWRFLSRAMCSTGATSYFNQRAEVAGSILENTGTPTSGASFVTNIVEIDRALAAGVTVQFAQLAGAAYTGIASDYGGQSTTVLAEYIGPA